MFGASLVQKQALITGATGGIGFATAVRLAREGADVVLLGRDNEKLDGVCNQARIELSKKCTRPAGSPGPGQIESWRLNVTDMEDWISVRDRFPEADILVNCAGVSQSTLLAKIAKENIDMLLAANLTGAIYGCKQIGRGWILNKRPGCIINVSSLLARKGTTGAAVYAAAKAGLVGVTTSLAVEWSRYGIRVNAILPGYIRTNMTKALREDPAFLEKIPAGRFGTPDEVADAVAFLAKNEYANNCILNLDGGLSAL